MDVIVHEEVVGEPLDLPPARSWKRRALLLGVLIFMLGLIATFILTVVGIYSAQRQTKEKWQAWRALARTPAQREVAWYIDSQVHATHSCNPNHSREPFRFPLTFKGARGVQLDRIVAHEKACAQVVRGQLRLNASNVADLAFAQALLDRVKKQSADHWH